VGLLKTFRKQLTQWASLLQRFLRNEDDQVGRARWRAAWLPGWLACRR
jgi:hypothetical protein